MSSRSQCDRLGLSSARVPRYTSYPPVPSFGPSVGAAEAAAWIEAIPPGASLSLYVHLPFCRRLCWFCTARTQGTTTGAPLRPYLETLKAELRLLGERLAPGVTIGHVHWGGGTPTLLPADMIAELAHAIAELAPHAPDAEFEVEIDPNEIDDARLDALAAAGLTRATIGVQDFDAEVQGAIGRRLSLADAAAAVAGLRRRGVSSLGIDLLHGLPRQRAAGLAASVQQVLALAPDRVSLSGYVHVPWAVRRQKAIRAGDLPGPEARLNLFQTARQILVGDGYAEIGMDHFARAGDPLAVAARLGRLRRSFHGYTDDHADALVGIGASAVSRFPQGLARNESSTSAYGRAIRAGTFATARGHAFAGDDLLRGGLIEALLCGFCADLGDLARRAGRSESEARALGDALAEAFPDLVIRRGPVLAVTEAGRPLVRRLALHLDRYAGAGARHTHAL